MTSRISEKALAVVCWLVISFHLVFSALGAIPGLSYEPKGKGLWLAAVAALLALALWMDARKGLLKSHWALLMPVLAGAVLRLFIPADGMGPWQCGLALADLILGGLLFARARAGRKLKLTSGVLAVLLLLPTLALMLLAATLGTGSNTLRRYPDPSGSFVAQVRIADEGATGGSTSVTVFQSWPVGPLRVVRGRVVLDWIDPDALEVQWLDDGALLINGEAWRWRNEKAAADAALPASET